MNFKSRLEQYCAVDTDSLLSKREKHAVELRKKKRNSLFNSARLLKANKPSDLSCLARHVVELRESENLAVKYDILCRIRKLIRNKTLDLITEENGSALIYEVIQYISPSASDQIAGEACWIVSNLAMSSHCVTIMVKSDIINKLLEVLCEDRTYTTENALWALANICGACEAHRKRMVNYGLHNFLSNFLQRLDNKNDLKSIKVISWLFVNLCAGTYQSSLAETSLNVNKQLMMFNDLDIDSNCLYCLVNLSETSDGSDAIVYSGLAQGLIRFLYNDSLKICKPALLVIRNLILNSRCLNIHLLDGNIFDGLMRVLSSEDSETRKETLVIVHGLIAGNYEHKKEFLNHRLMIRCLERLTDSSFSCQKESSYIVNFVMDEIDFEEVYQELEYSFFDILRDALAHTDPSFLQNILEFTDRLLRFDFENPFFESGCYEKLEKLQFHGNAIISNFAQDIINTTISLDDTSEEND